MKYEKLEKFQNKKTVTTPLVNILGGARLYLQFRNSIIPTHTLPSLICS